jgi:hypothetical protein
MLKALQSVQSASYAAPSIVVTAESSTVTLQAILPPIDGQNKVEAILYGRRVSDETETYSPGSRDISAGCNSL